MVAIKAKTLKKIKAVQGEVEPHIVDMIKCSDEGNCPYKVLKKGDYESEDAKDAVTKIARMLYKTGLLTIWILGRTDLVQTRKRYLSVPGQVLLRKLAKTTDTRKYLIDFY
jgi:hypothetical protein